MVVVAVREHGPHDLEALEPQLGHQLLLVERVHHLPDLLDHLRPTA